MKRILIAVAMLVVLGSAVPAALEAQTTEPATIVIDQTEAFKSADYDAALVYYADDAVYRLEYVDEAYTAKPRYGRGGMSWRPRTLILKLRC